MLVGDILRATASRYPGKTGLVCGEKRFTWHDVNERTNRLANALLTIGLQHQDRVAILCRNCNEYMEFYFAVSKAGLIGVPLNTWLKKRELEYLVLNSGARVLLVDSEMTPLAASLDVPCIEKRIGLGKGHALPLDYDSLLALASPGEPEAMVTENDGFVLSYTSGTTGLPKGAMITHRNACSAITNNALEWRLLPCSIYLLHAPMFFAAGGGSRLHCVLRGCTSIIITYEAELALQTIEKERVTHFSMSPTPLRRILDFPDFAKYDLSSVRMIGLTGAPHSITEIEKIERLFGHVWFSSWGMAETGTLGTTLQPEEVSMVGPTSKRVASVGRADIGIEVKVINEWGGEVAHDGREMGEAILKGDAVTVGYWEMPEETASALKDGWFYSGDMATVDTDGFIYIVDRKKDLIKSGGIGISAREIEEVIYRHPAVASCAVVGIPDEQWGETPKAVVVVKPGMTCQTEEILSICRQNLASYKKPTSVDFVEHMPLNASGKIVKREVKAWYWKDHKKLVH